MQNPFFNQFFAFFEQLLPCQVTILQHLRDVAKALRKLKQPIDAEGWTEVHDIFNSKHSPRGVEGLKRKFNKLANKPVPTGNPNIPEDANLQSLYRVNYFVVLEPQTSPTRRRTRKRTRKKKKKNLMTTSLQKPSTKIYPPSLLSQRLRCKKF